MFKGSDEDGPPAPLHGCGRGCQARREENLAALARMHTEDAIAVLVSIANDPKVNPSARISAANSLLDRGHGKPPQAVAVKTDSNGDTFLRLWRYLTVGEGVPEAEDVID